MEVATPIVREMARRYTNQADQVERLATSLPGGGVSGGASNAFSCRIVEM